MYEETKHIKLRIKWTSIRMKYSGWRNGMTGTKNDCVCFFFVYVFCFNGDAYYFVVFGPKVMVIKVFLAFCIWYGCHSLQRN